MTRVHVPVLAGELIELTAPAAGETVVDCTFGAGGHARLIADRIGPSGTRVCIDRDPLAEEHFDELASEVACETRFLRMDYADGLEIVRRRDRAPIETTGELVAAIEAALPAAVRRSFGGGSPAKRVFQAIRIAVNSELDSLDRALPLAWELLPVGGRLAAISFHSLEDRRVKRFLAERARGCVCPPDFPVCVCGREPEAELITGRAVVPTPGEVADNPRAKSSRLRSARKLAAEEND